MKLTSKISAFFEISEFLFSFIVIGFATSLPEIFISISAAISGNSVLAFGNTIGSNIIYPTLLVGLVVLVASKITVISYKEVLNKNTFYVFGISLLPLFFMLDLNLSRVEGIFLLAVFFFYLLYLIKKRELFPRRIYTNKEAKILFSVNEFIKNLFYLILSFMFLYIGSEGVVRSTLGIVSELKVSLIFISIFIVALGAALPEIVFSVQAALRGKKEVIMGNMMGSLAVNSSLALGVAAIINPINIQQNIRFFYISAAAAFCALLFFVIFVRSGNILSRREGIAMVLFYILFAAAAYFFK
mgnify:FL=1